jgi:carboxyl-terminal processing protease
MIGNSRSSFIALSLILIISALAFIAGINAAPSLGRLNPQADATDLQAQLQKISEIWGYLKQDYVDQERLDVNTQGEGAIRGMLSTLNDPFTTYLDAQHYKAEIDYLHGKFEGIGAHVGVEDGKITIIAPMPGSPADKAGIRPGDIVMKINGQPTEGISLNEAVIRIRGPKDTPVKLEILHRGETTPVEMEIIRAEIDIKTVFSRMIDNIAYKESLPFQRIQTKS